MKKYIEVLCITIVSISVLFGCANNKLDNKANRVNKSIEISDKKSAVNIEYSYKEYNVKRNDIDLHLDCVSVKGKKTKKDILLIHGVTYSSNEFDTDYKDYSLVRKLAKEGYAVWRLDIAGYGQSGKVKDGFMPDTDYAAGDITAATDKITKVSKRKKIDILGWSWGTATVSRFATKHSDKLGKIVLYAPILYGIGEYKVKEAFHHNSWEHAADDFQKKADGSLDYNITEKNVIDIFCSNCWHYDGEYSPNGGRRDLCVSSSVQIIDLEKLSNPTLIICGDNDPYLYNDKIKESLKLLPKGSKLEIIKGASHVAMIEKPYYHDFQDKLTSFLDK